MQFLDGAGAAAMALGALGVGAGVLGVVGAGVGCLVTFTIGSLNVGEKEGKMHSINLEYKFVVFFL